MIIQYYNKINEANGFYNPFANIDETPSSLVIQEDPLARQGNNDVQYLKCKVWNSNTKGKTYCTQHTLPNGDTEYRMFAGKFFHKGDIIEEAPVKIMNQNDLFSKTIYSVCFPIDKAKGIYALPIGYSTCYRNSYESRKEGNVIYEYNEEKHTLVFRAYTNIKRNDELILFVTDDDFENVVKPGQFEYWQGLEPLENITSARVV